MLLTIFAIFYIAVNVNRWIPVYGSPYHCSFNLHQAQYALHKDVSLQYKIIWNLFPFHIAIEPQKWPLQEPLSACVVFLNTVFHVVPEMYGYYVFFQYEIDLWALNNSIVWFHWAQWSNGQKDDFSSTYCHYKLSHFHSRIPTTLDYTVYIFTLTLCFFPILTSFS
jgi:hypothetical protein